MRVTCDPDSAVKLEVVTGHATTSPAQLLVYGFGPDADFEGRLLGALERIESGGTVRILDALFVANDPETGELVAVDLRGAGAGGIVAPLLLFRLDPAERRRATERTLSAHSGGVPAGTLRELGTRLEPGAALVALLLEHEWVRALEDAAARSGGTPLTNQFVDTTGLAELAPDLLAAAVRAGDSTER
jgi:hypothetical protein